LQSHVWFDGVEAPLIRDLLSTNLEFDTLGHAIETLNYNGALLYIMQLQQAARRRTVAVEALSAEDMDHLRRIDRQSSENPLLLPDQATLICQPALEALRMIPFISGGRLTHDEKSTLMTFVPFAAIFWTLMRQLEWKDHIVAILDKLPVFKDAQSVFSRH
jgi:hypothetical protein